MFLKKGSILELVDIKHLGRKINIDTLDVKDLSYAMLRITVSKKSFNNKMRFRGIITYSTDKEKYQIGEVFETEGRSKIERLDLDYNEYTWYHKTRRNIIGIELRHFLYKTLSLNGPVEHPDRYFNRDNRVGHFYTLIKTTESIRKHRELFMEEKNQYKMSKMA